MRIYKKDISVEEWRDFLNSRDSRFKFSDLFESNPWVEVPNPKPVDMTGKTTIELDNKTVLIDKEGSPIGDNSIRANVDFKVTIDKVVGSHQNAQATISTNSKKMGFQFDKDIDPKTLYGVLNQASEDLHVDEIALIDTFDKEFKRITW